MPLPTRSECIPAPKGAKHVAHRPTEAARVESRGEARYEKILSLTAWPVFPDGQLDDARRLDGFAWDLSTHGAGIELNAGTLPARADWLIGVETPQAEYAYAGLQLLHREQGLTFGLRCGGRFGGLAETILQEDNLLPRLDGRRLQFVMPLAEEVYRSWTEAGVLRRDLLDTVLLCPTCRCVPTFRQACRACGSARVRIDRLIHHYVCGHVAQEMEFETPSGLVCPKCKTERLVVGADYEYHTGPYQCRDCQWRDAELRLTGHCTGCDLRFTADEAHSHPLYGYHAARLDPLALLAAPR